MPIPCMQMLTMFSTNVSIEKTSGAVHEFACTQVQKTIAGRHDILKETTLKDYLTVHPKDHKNGWNVASNGFI